VSFLFSPQADDCIKTYYQMYVKDYFGIILNFFSGPKKPEIAREKGFLWG